MKRHSSLLWLLIVATSLCATNGTGTLSQAQTLPAIGTVTLETPKGTELETAKTEASTATITNSGLAQLIQDNNIEAIEKLLTANPALARIPLTTDEKPPRTITPLKFAREVLDDRYKQADPKEKDLLLIKALLNYGATPTDDPELLPFLIQSFNQVPEQYVDRTLKVLDLFLNTYQFKPSKDSHELLQTLDKKIAELLIHHGADVNATTERGVLKGSSLLENVIAQGGPLWKINLLLEHGAKTNAAMLKKIKELEDSEPENLTRDAVRAKTDTALIKILDDKRYASYRTKDGKSLGEVALATIFLSTPFEPGTDLKLIKIILDRQSDPAATFLSTYPSFLFNPHLNTHDTLAILTLFASYPTVNFARKDVSDELYGYLVYQPKPDIAAFFVSHGVQIPEYSQKQVKELVKKAKKEISPLTHHAKLQSEIKQRAQEKEKKSKAAAAKSKEESAKKFTGLTQTEAYLRAWFHDTKTPIQNLVTKILANYYTTDARKKLLKSHEDDDISEGFSKAEIPNYQRFAEKIIAKERALQADYYVFYHGYDPALTLMFMVQKALLHWLSLTFGSQQNLALRFKTEIREENVQDFIDHWEQFFLKAPITDPEILESEGLQGAWNPWDNYVKYTKADGSQGSLGDLMLSVNPSLFGNTIHSGTGSFYYFTDTLDPMQGNSILKNFLKAWNFDTKYLADFFAAFEAYRRPSKANGLLQIFIPKNRVDEFVYLALPYGTPYRKALAPSFSEQKHRHTKISDLLDAYMQRPLSFDKKTINELEMRIVFVPSFFEPETGILYESYDVTSTKNKTAFRKKFAHIFETMLNEWLVTKAYERVLPKESATTPFLRLLQLKALEEQFLKTISQESSQGIMAPLAKLNSQLEQFSKLVTKQA